MFSSIISGGNSIYRSVVNLNMVLRHLLGTSMSYLIVLEENVPNVSMRLNSMLLSKFLMNLASFVIYIY